MREIKTRESNVGEYFQFLPLASNCKCMQLKANMMLLTVCLSFCFLTILIIFILCTFELFVTDCWCLIYSISNESPDVRCHLFIEGQLFFKVPFVLFYLNFSFSLALQFSCPSAPCCVTPIRTTP